MSSNETVSNRIHTILNECQLPAEEAEQEGLLRAFEDAIAEVTGKHGLHPERTKVLHGHLYAQIHIRCPNCSCPVSLREPELVDNAAYASVTCTGCEWAGLAVYRAIDLVDTEGMAYAWHPTHSAVQQGDIDPIYVPY